MIIIISLICNILFSPPGFRALAQSTDEEPNTNDKPTVTDSNLTADLIFDGPGFPTSMTFIGADDILLLSKNDGQVLRIKDGHNLGPVLTVNASSKDEMGLLGIATSKNNSGSSAQHVFIFYTSCKSETECNSLVYKYDWSQKEGKMTNPVLLLKLPGLPGPSHMGGKIAVGPDGFIYLTVGDMTPTDLFNKIEEYKTMAQNYEEGVKADGRAGILRITQDGKPVNGGIIGKEYPANLYFAYGIKNSFGLGFDPITGHLWDTENGPKFGDEINLVQPGFNSGWSKIQGFWRVSETAEQMEELNSTNPSGLVLFSGKGKYFEPKLVWDKNIAPTAIAFVNSSKLGPKYSNDMFVGSVKDGKIFNFDMNGNRSDLLFPNSAKDRILSKDEETSATFAQGFGIVTDLQVGPYDGNLYVVAGDKANKAAAIYRIVLK